MTAVNALALFGPIGTTELILILLVFLLLFGASKLPQLGGALGKTIKNFKSEMKGGMAEDSKESVDNRCKGCGAEIVVEAEFCPKCGKKL